MEKITITKEFYDYVKKALLHIKGIVSMRRHPDPELLQCVENRLKTLEEKFKQGWASKNWFDTFLERLKHFYKKYEKLKAVILPVKQKKPVTVPPAAEISQAATFMQVQAIGRAAVKQTLKKLIDYIESYLKEKAPKKPVKAGLFGLPPQATPFIIGGGALTLIGAIWFMTRRKTEKTSLSDIGQLWKPFRAKPFDPFSDELIHYFMSTLSNAIVDHYAKDREGEIRSKAMTEALFFYAFDDERRSYIERNYPNIYKLMFESFGDYTFTDGKLIEAAESEISKFTSRLRRW